MQQHILITGGNKGIGLALTKLCLDAGFKVSVIARDLEEFIYADAVNCVAYDLSDIAGIKAMVSTLGRVDVLVNNAGVMYSLPYDNYPQEKVERMLKLNLEAPVKLMELCAQAGVKRIVNNASIAGQIGHPDVWYGITKAGLINATKSFAKIFAGEVVVNAVAPSPVETDMLETIPLARREAFLKTVVSGRFAKPEEIAQTIFWLATDAPEYINGTTIDINSSALMR